MTNGDFMRSLPNKDLAKMICGWIDIVLIAFGLPDVASNNEIVESLEKWLGEEVQDAND